MVLKLLEQSERHLEAAGVELSAHGMYANKPSVECLAEPVTVFWLYHPMAYALVIVKLPWVDAVEGLEGVFATGLEFQSDVRSCGAPIEQVSLESQLLGISRYSHEQCYDEQSQSVCYVFSHIVSFFKMF